MTPVDVPLQSIARDAVKMFEGEAKAAGVALDYVADMSCNQVDTEYVSMDPTRVLQILIVSTLTTFFCPYILIRTEPYYQCHKIHEA